MLNKLLPPIVILALIGALVYGKMEFRQETSNLVQSSLAGQYEVKLSGAVYDLRPVGEGGEQLAGWAAVAEGAGFAGPLTVIAVFDTAGILQQGQVARHGETTLFYNLARPAELIRGLIGKSYAQIAQGNYQLDTVSGASATTGAVLTAIGQAAEVIGEAPFGFIPAKQSVQFEFGFAEVVVIILFLSGILAVKRKISYKAQLRFITQAAGLLVIGFWENSPISMVKITSFLLGYIPSLYTGFYWYLLLGGFVFSILLTGRNIHCRYVCPFGAMQRFTGLIGGADKSLPTAMALWARRIRNLLVISLLFYAFLSNNAGIAGYEPFGTAFTLNGTVLYWLLLVTVLTSSLFLRNPWCHYLCPIQSIAELLISVRRKLESLLSRNGNGEKTREI
ncbi:MAG: 4Fe-4S binding protein [Chloroflexi bacterium]|nr:4Fe-4S binding protein [Chloroflexota bacterium]